MAKKKPEPEPDFSGDGWIGLPIPESGMPEIEAPGFDDPFMQAQMELMLDAAFAIQPTTDDELWDYIRLYMGTRIPRVAVCPGHQAPFTSVADLFFLRFPEENALLVGGRGSGKTLNFALVEVLLMKFFADTIANVGAVEEQAKKCYSYIQRVNRSPRFEKLVKSSMLSKTVYDNGAEIEILPGTMNRVNSPHPRIACLDEIDLMPWAVMQEALSMPVRTNGRPPQTVYTSSLKKRYGPMVRLMEEADERAIRTYTFCVFEVIENCPPERHQQGEGCMVCPLAKECLDQQVRVDGTIEYMPGPGRASRAEGFMRIDDVIKTYRSLDTDTWDSQWRCKKPSAKNLIYPQFDETIHVIEYEWNPNLPVYAGYDFGYTNPSVGIYLQVLPSDEIVVFAENYGSGRTDVEFARSVKAEPWFRTTIARDGDPAAASGRATFKEQGVEIVAAINTKDIANDESGISKLRWLLAPPGRDRPLLYFAKGKVPHTIREIKSYHVMEQSAVADKNTPEQAAKVDDHCMDALRYGVSRLIKRKKARSD